MSTRYRRACASLGAKVTTFNIIRVLARHYSCLESSNTCCYSKPNLGFRMAFNISLAEVLVLYKETLPMLFGCCIAVHTVEHRTDGPAFLRLRNKVPTERRGMLTDRCGVLARLSWILLIRRPQTHTVDCSRYKLRITNFYGHSVAAKNAFPRI